VCGVVVAPSWHVEHAMANLMHRGIRSRIILSDRVSVGHVRLPIVGLAEEYDQPYEDTQWVVAFVGEILDYKDWSTYDCDFPLVTETWTSEGPEGFRKFDGFWSVIAYSKVTHQVHLLVDYLAQKPLYYRTDILAAASEPDAVACLEPVTPDEVYLSAVVKWGYCPETWRTPYQEVRKTRPGEHVILEGDECARCELVDILEPLPVNLAGLKSEIIEATKRRVLSSDVPVAALVSGGLDSAIVYTLAKRFGDVRAYHVENDETLAAAAVIGSGKHSLLDYKDVTLPRALEVMQEPLDLGSLLPQLAVSDAIARAGKERVCLTGDGADELFGGYGRAARYDSQWSDVFHELVAWHLPRLDRVMMRNLVEVRSPFLARDVVEAALGLPWAERRDKRVLRELFREDLPAGVADRPKKALRTPAVEKDREKNSKLLVDLFRQKYYGDHEEAI